MIIRAATAPRARLTRETVPLAALLVPWGPVAEAELVGEPEEPEFESAAAPEISAEPVGAKT